MLHRINQGSIVTVLFIFSLSPLFATVLAAIVVIHAKLASLQKPNITFLLGRSLIYAIIAAAVSFGFMAVWMIWYESSTGFSADKGYSWWMLFFGPLSAAFGQVVALIDWWFKKVTITP